MTFYAMCCFTISSTAVVDWFSSFSSSTVSSFSNKANFNFEGHLDFSLLLDSELRDLTSSSRYLLIGCADYEGDVFAISGYDVFDYLSGED